MAINELFRNLFKVSIEFQEKLSAPFQICFGKHVNLIVKLLPSRYIQNCIHSLAFRISLL